ncbi:hypothetical protein, partial [Enterobacter sp. Ag1]|uniref:hypothetical protein n=1 Tax=Enterobacter sp. Ag1 TaxID=1202448 RepID=UPI001ED8D50A
WITRHQLNSQRTGETGNMKKNQPTLLTEGFIETRGQVTTITYKIYKRKYSLLKNKNLNSIDSTGMQSLSRG